MSPGIRDGSISYVSFEQALAGDPPILKSLAEVMDMNFMDDDSEPEICLKTSA